MVLELSADVREVEVDITTRYVIVIDVSGSMDDQIRDYDERTLLDRTKVKKQILTLMFLSI